jgi:hypothetical protein
MNLHDTSPHRTIILIDAEAGALTPYQKIKKIELSFHRKHS